MKQRFLAFDIEIAALLPENATNWKKYRPFGITCAAMAWQDNQSEIQTAILHGKNEHGQPAPRMTQAECQELVRKLQQSVENGFTLLTHNGLSFDFDVLAEESGFHDVCVELALNHHVDSCLQIHCVKGFPVGLDAIAQGMGLSGKQADMTGALAPQMWADGKYAEVLAYVTQDVATTLAIAAKIEKQKRLSWVARSGRLNHCPLPKGLLTVKEALQLPLPDTGWMSNPMPRSHFLEWTGLSLAEAVERWK